MSVERARYCAIGKQCSQYRFLRAPAKLRSTTESSICEPCLKAGYRSGAFLTAPDENRDSSEPERCAACSSCSYGLVEDKGEHVCERCTAAFLAARTLLEAEIEEESEIIPTLAFAKRAAESTFLASRKELAQISQEMGIWDWFLKRFAEEVRGLRPVCIVNGVLVLRQEPATVEVKKYAGTRFLRQILINVFSRSADPETVAELYKQILVEHNARSRPSSGLSVRPEFVETWLKVTIDPDIVLHPDEARWLAMDPQKRGFAFPSPAVIQNICQSYFGSVDRRRGGNWALMLQGRNRGKSMSAKCLIPAFAAWYLGVYAASEGDPTPRKNRATVPTEHKVHVARVVNRHVLGPCGLKELPEDGRLSNESLWRNVKKVDKSFLKTETLLLQDPSDK